MTCELSTCTSAGPWNVTAPSTPTKRQATNGYVMKRIPWTVTTCAALW